MDGSMTWTAPIVGALAVLCATGTAVAASGSSNSGYAVSEEIASLSGSRVQLAARILEMHNAERSRLRLEPLKWNIHLEREAEQWAAVLSSKGALQHADRSVRNGTGENLWMGTAGGWPVETMVEKFLEERKHYRHDNFPNISRTGSWSDVGHYTQIVWRDTKEVGCAIVTARGNDVLVCRYWPAGNIWGQRAY